MHMISYARGPELNALVRRFLDARMPIVQEKAARELERRLGAT
jgi:hypothetical protein